MTTADEKNIPTDLAGAETITVEALKKRNPEIFAIMEPWGKESTVYYYAEDKTIDGDFEMDSYDGEGILGFVFEKNLTVNGDIIQMEGDYGPHLLVMGNLKAKNLDKGGSYMDIYGDCDIDGLIYGYYNHGMLDIGGVTRAQYIIEDDHSMSFGEVDEDRLVAEIDMWSCDLSKLFLPELIVDESRIDVEAARALLNEGKPILVDGWAIVDREDDDEDDEEEEEDAEAVSGTDYREYGLSIQPCEFDGQAHGLFLGLAVKDNQVLAVGGQGRTLMAYSEDGLQFQLRQMASPGLRSACFSGEAMWVAGEYGFVAMSDNGGKSWKEIVANKDECLFGIVEDESGALWSAGDDGYIACSKDHKKFKKVKGVEESIGRISMSPLGILVPTDEPGYLYRVEKSKLTKTALEAETDLMVAMVTGKGTLIVVGGNGGIFRSTDQGETFETVESGTARMFTCIGQLPGGILLAFGERGIVALSSDDGAAFTQVAQDVCRETIWCCKNYEDSLLLGAGGGQIYRLQLGPAKPITTQISRISKDDLEKGKYIRVSRMEFEGLLEQMDDSALYRETMERVCWDTMFLDEDEVKEDDIYCQVYVGDIRQDTPLTFQGSHTLVIGDIQAPWVNLANPLPFDEGGSFIVIGNVECEHFNNHWGKAAIINGNLTAKKILVNAFEDAALFVTGNLTTEFFYGMDIGADVGGKATMTYGNGYCLRLTAGESDDEEDYSSSPDHSEEESYHFLGLDEEADVSDVMALLKENYGK